MAEPAQRLRGLLQGCWPCWLVAVSSAVGAGRVQPGFIGHQRSWGDSHRRQDRCRALWPGQPRAEKSSGLKSTWQKILRSRLGVRLVKVPVSTEARFQKLELGEVDLLLATVGDSLERQKDCHRD